MTQFRNDFSSVATGSGVPAGWTDRSGGVLTAAIVSDGDAPSGKALSLDNFDLSNRYLTWNAPGLVSDIEVLALVKAYVTDASSYTGIHLYSRANSAGDTAYALRAEDDQNGFRMFYSTATDSYTGINFGAGATWGQGNVIAVRYRVVGTSLKSRIWEPANLSDVTADEPATWDAEETDGNITSAGYFGVGGRQVIQTQYLLYVGATDSPATESAPAPLSESLNANEVKVRLSDAWVLKAIRTPGDAATSASTLGGVGNSFETLTSYPKLLNVTSGDYYVDPTAGTNGSGTEASPFDNLASAISAASDGDTILVKAGTLTPSSRFVISGTYATGLNIFNYGTSRPIIDCSSLGTGSSARVFTITGSGVHVKGFEIRDSAEYPIVVNGANNKIEDCHIHGCARTNVYLYGSGSNNNVVQDTWSWDVRGAATSASDDDNFASTANSGDSNSGNAFVRCVGANGPDDGYDLFRGTSVDILSSVVIGSGYYNDGTSAGDGNGFKMGGDVGGNRVEGCIAVGVKVQGFDANITTDSTMQFLRNTSVDAGTRGFNTYAAADANIKDNISIENGTEPNSGTNDGTYNSWNSSSDAGGNAAFPLTLAEIDFVAPASYDYSLDTASDAISASSTGGNLGASTEALEILKDFMATYSGSVYHR